MADIDLLPTRGVPFAALVDANGIATNGSSTVAQLAAKGMRAICAVDGSGNATTGSGTMLQLAQRGIKAFCPVDENGVALDASTADAIRKRGIRPMVLLGNNGVALTGSATMLTLAQRGLDYFCPLDEGGNATTMGAVVLLSNTTVLDNATIGTTIGTLSVAGGTGTYTFTLLSNPGGLFATAGTNGVNLNVAAALPAGIQPITVRAAGGVPTPVDRVFNITVQGRLPAGGVPTISGSITVGATLTAATGTWTGSAPITYTYQWKSGGSNVGTNSSTYSPVTGDLGNTITVTVTATNVTGSASATSAPVGPITDIVGIHAGVGTFAMAGEDMTPAVGHTMAADVGAFVLIDPGTTQMSPPPLALSLDGTPVNGESGGVSLVLPPLTTLKANSIILVTGITNSGLVTGVTSPHLTFTQRVSNVVFAYWALATSPLVNEVITISAPSSSHLGVRAWAVTNARIASPFDSAGVLTAYGTGADPADIVTIAANAMVYGVWTCGNSDPAAGSGFTRVPVASVGDYTLIEYQIYNTNGTKTVTIGVPDTGSSVRGWLDAIVAGP